MTIVNKEIIIDTGWVVKITNKSGSQRYDSPRTSDFFRRKKHAEEHADARAYHKYSTEVIRVALVEIEDE